MTPERKVTRDGRKQEEQKSFAFAHRVLVATCIVSAVALVRFFVWYTADC